MVVRFVRSRSTPLPTLRHYRLYATTYVRRTLQLGGALTVENARRLQAQKLQKEANKKAKKETRIARLATIQARKELRQAGVAARKLERLRKKRVAALRKAGQPILPEDQEPIPDPEAQAQAQEATENKSGSGSGSGSGSEESDESSVEFHL